MAFAGPTAAGPEKSLHVLVQVVHIVVPKLAFVFWSSPWTPHVSNDASAAEPRPKPQVLGPKPPFQ